jgi:CO/xanthine dehydrogenase Mo-binding subunit
VRASTATELRDVEPQTAEIVLSANGQTRRLELDTRTTLLRGMSWGMSMALQEEAVMDTRSGAVINRDLANYLVPVHADIPELDVVFRKDFDDKANVLGARGLGELGICGSGAAVANAVFNATGVRVRELPITLEKVLQEMVSRPASPVVNSTP